MTRIRYQGRNHDTPRYMPVQIREDIHSMDEHSEFNSGWSWLAVMAVGAIFWTAVFAWVLA